MNSDNDLEMLSPRATIPSSPPSKNGRPDVPTPYASFAEVEIFLEAFLISVGHPPADAVTDAEKLRVDGKGLFEIPAEFWVDKLGHRGNLLYNHIQETKFGQARFPSIPRRPALPYFQELV